MGNARSKLAGKQDALDGGVSPPKREQSILKRRKRSWSKDLSRWPSIKSSKSKTTGHKVSSEYGPHGFLKELARVDLLMSRTAFDGTDFSAPVADALREGVQVLAIGPSVSEWVSIMAKRYSNSNFTSVATSTMPLPLEPSTNINITYTSSLNELTFEPPQFDYIMLFYLALVTTTTAWDALLEKATRALKPGGWIEVWDVPFTNQINAGPNNRQECDMCVTTLFAQGIDPLQILHIPNMLRFSGRMTHVTTKPVELAMNRQNPDYGSLVTYRLDFMVTQLAPLMCKAYGMEQEQYHQWVRETLWPEAEAYNTKLRFYRVYAQRV